MYEQEKILMGKSFRVKEPWRVKSCVMRVGDILTVVDYGSGCASHYVKFTNARLPSWTFSTGTWRFAGSTEETGR